MALGMKKAICGLAMAGLMLAGSVPAFAGWNLDGSKSSIGFSSVKNDAVFEQHGFRNLSGSISDDGEVKLTIDLNSVDTNIQIRDERMKKELFDTEKFPFTTAMAKVDVAKLKALAPGKTEVTDVEFALDLHGKNERLVASVQITGLENGGLLVSTIKSVEVKAGAFGLDGGVDKLRDIAKLNSILLSVPVNANLVFLSE